MRIGALLAVGRCLSVRHTRLLHPIQMAKKIIKLSSEPGSPIILVFESKHHYDNFQGEPLQRGH